VSRLLYGQSFSFKHVFASIELLIESFLATYSMIEPESALIVLHSINYYNPECVLLFAKTGFSGRRSES
jgi:hypothetical protein